MLIKFCKNDARRWKNWWFFCHKNHWQERNAIRIIAHPAFGFLVLDEFDNLSRKLVEEGLACWDIDDCELYAADVCTRHGNVVYCVHTPYSLNHQGYLPPVFLNNVPVDLVALLFDLFGSILHKLSVGLWCVLERVDWCRLVDPASLKIGALEACVEVILCEFWGNTTSDISLLRGLRGVLLFSSLGSVEKIVTKRLLSWVAWTEADLASRSKNS